MNYSKLIIFLVTIFLFSSCKKEEIKPDNTVVGDTNVYEFVDIDWVLSDARFYMDNLDNGDKTFYDHFSNTQNESTLDPINGADIPFDTIVKGVTTWRFSSDNFILNNSNFYAFTHINETITAVGMENGSARPMTIIEIDDVDTPDLLGEVCANLQPGDTITFNVIAALEHDLFDFNQTNFSGFIINRSSSWEDWAQSRNLLPAVKKTVR